MADQKMPLGRHAVLYYNTADKRIGETGVETIQLWLDDPATVAAPEVRNMALDLSNIDADTNTRGNTAGGYASVTPVLKNAGHTFDTPFDTTSSFVEKLIQQWDGFTTIGLVFLQRDKATATTGDKLWGWGGNCNVGLTKDEEITDIQRVNFTANHRDNGAWYSATAP